MDVLHGVCMLQVSGAEGGSGCGATLWRHVSDTCNTGQRTSLPLSDCGFAMP